MITTPDNSGQDIMCKLCHVSRDEMCHVLECVVVKLACQDLNQMNNVKISDAFGDFGRMKALVSVYQKMWRKRIEILDN